MSEQQTVDQDLVSAGATPAARPLRLAAALLGVLLLAHAAHAADSPSTSRPLPDPARDTAPTDAASSERASPEAADPTKPAAEDGKSPASSPEVFVPSEEISEDYTVSFPIDI